jgi:hypothetical protein
MYKENPKSSPEALEYARSYMARRRREQPDKVEASKQKSLQKRQQDGTQQAMQAAAHVRWKERDSERYARQHLKNVWTVWNKDHPDAQLSLEQYTVQWGQWHERSKAAKARTPDEQRQLCSSQFKNWQARERKTNPLKTMLRRVRNRAARSGLEFSITEVDLLVDGKVPIICPVFGTQLVYDGGNGAPGKYRPETASLDRIDNSLGYVPGNVMIISFRANRVKQDATLKEIQQIASYMWDHLLA